MSDSLWHLNLNLLPLSPSLLRVRDSIPGRFRKSTGSHSPQLPFECRGIFLEGSSYLTFYISLTHTVMCYRSKVQTNVAERDLPYSLSPTDRKKLH